MKILLAFAVSLFDHSGFERVLTAFSLRKSDRQPYQCITKVVLAVVVLLVMSMHAIGANTLSEAMAECQANLPSDQAETYSSPDYTWSISNHFSCRAFGRGEHSLSALYYEHDAYSDGSAGFLSGEDVALNGTVMVTGPVAMMEYKQNGSGECNEPSYCEANVLGTSLSRYANLAIYYANEDDHCPLDGSTPTDGSICLPQENLNDDQNDAGTPDCGVGNPCNPSTGNKFQVEQDYDGVLKFDRYYNSLTRWQAERALPTGWTHSYSSHLYTRVDVVNKRFDFSNYTLDVMLGFKVSNYYQRYDGKLTRLSVATLDRLEYPTESELNTLSYTNVYDPNLLKINTVGVYPFSLDRASAGNWEVENENGVKEIFDGAGRLIKRIEKNGYVETLQYNGNQLISVTGESGHKLQISYDAGNGYINQITTPENSIIKYDIGGSGFSATVGSNVVNYYGFINSVTYPDNSVRHYQNERHFAGSNNQNAVHLTGITDENGDAFAVFGYDQYGRAILSEHAGGMQKVTLQYSWTPFDVSVDPLTTTVTDGNNTSTYSFNRYSIGTKLVEKDDGGANVTITRDSSGRITERQVLNQELSTNNTTRYTYTGNLLTSVVEFYGTPLQRQTLIQYYNNDPAFSSRYETNSVYASGKTVKQITYNINNQPTSVLTTGYTPTGAAVQRDYQYGYNSNGHLTSVDGPLTGATDTTLYDYYECSTGAACGQLKSIIDPLGHITRFNIYDGAGRVLNWTDQNGVTSDNTYDSRGRLTKITTNNPGGMSLVTQYQYDAVGQLKGIIKGDYAISFQYSAAHKLDSITDGVGNKITYAYDNGGHKTDESVVDKAGILRRTVQYTYDYLNQLESVIRPGNVTTSYTYDSVGNIASIDGPINSTSFTYDLRGLVTQKIGGSIGEVTEYAFDKSERLTDLTAGNHAHTRYVYDDLGNALQQISPDSGTTTLTYDLAGNVKSSTDARGIVTNYTYDTLNRLTSVSYPTSGENISYTWDIASGCAYGIGRLCQVTDGSGTTTYAYDALGNKVKETVSEAGVSYITQYTYDSANLVKTQIMPTGSTINLIHDAAGRINAVSATYGAITTTLVGQIDYDAGTEQITTRVLGNGVKQSADYDLNGQPVATGWNIIQGVAAVDGDLNNDGVVNIVDVLLVTRMVNGLIQPTANQVLHGDVAPAGHPNGVIDVADMLRILRKANQLENF
jgi:YD repeat-containing protein